MYKYIVVTFTIYKYIEVKYEKTTQVGLIWLVKNTELISIDLQQ